MLILALSNLRHHKVRTGLSVLAVAIAITLLLVLVGLSQGTLNEISHRMQSVEAEIVVRDKHFDLGSMSGGKLWEKEIPYITQITLDSAQDPTTESDRSEASPLLDVERVIPVFLGRMKLAELTQNVFGINPADFIFFSGQRRLVEGHLFSDLSSPQEAVEQFDAQGIVVGEKARELPLIIDQRLAQAADLGVGDTAGFGDIPARIVGVVQTGVAGRVFAPINTLRGANGIAARTAHLFFVKARDALSTNQLYQLCDKIQEKTHRQADLVANYGQVLRENFRNLTIFVGIVSLIALIICFLFILVTIHTSVLERSKEIAILQSLGAGHITILGQTIQEALLICALGTVLGIGLTYGSRWLIESSQPLMTVEIRPVWMLIAVIIGLGGGALSAIYPGYLALRHDPVAALSFE